MRVSTKAKQVPRAGWRSAQGEVATPLGSEVKRSVRKDPASWGPMEDPTLVPLLHHSGKF